MRTHRFAIGCKRRRNLRIADNFGGDEGAAQRAREKLAAILLALPIGGERDPGELADLALETMAFEPRRGR